MILSDYGRKNAFKLGYDMGCAGATIVSGMAIGIDGVAMAGAIAAGAPVEPSPASTTFPVPSTLLDNYSVAAVDLDASRDNVSSVDLNDEATNLMQYQSAYNAAARVITTIDEALDKLINGTGAVGR